MPPSPDDLLASLEAAKSNFGLAAAAETAKLLDQLGAQTAAEPKSLLRFHETLLFLRAFPQAASLVQKIEKLLDTFHARVEHLRATGADMSIFDDFDSSGLSGTVMQDTLSFEAARWLVRRIPNNVEIVWDEYADDYSAERAWGLTWPGFIPLLAEDADVEANVPWRRWLDTARGRQRDLEFLIQAFERLNVTDRQRVELYDSLRIPIRWRLENLKLTRTRNWTRARKLYIHTEPLITRAKVSLARELAQPAPRLTKLSLKEGAKVIETIREIMLVRYRELYGTTIGDPRSVVRARLDRGVVIYLWNLPPTRRLPLRAYVAGFTLKNGVPINYIEAIGLCEWIEVGFNTFYTYRQGETAWIYAQALRCLHAFTGATTVSVYPYQIGQNNDEALDSGAFWFYRKLGFHCGRPDLEALARREEQKIARDPKYRTPRKTLRRLAEAHVFYELEGSPSADKAEVGRATTAARLEVVTFPSAPFPRVHIPNTPQTGRGTTFSRAINAAQPQTALAADGPWDTFSTRNLGLRVNQRMAGEFGGDSQRMRDSSIKEVSRALGVNRSRWSSEEQQAFENWALVLALIPGLRRWSSQEKRELVKIIRAQAGAQEMRYLRLTQHHAPLRTELLRLGSSAPRGSSN